jgi:hypothetical protein
MALTLLEANKLNDGDIKRSAIVEMFAMNADLLRVMPFEDIQGGSLTYSEEHKLPGIGFRGVNEGYSESVGIVNQRTEALRIGGGDLDVDKFLIKTRGAEIRSQQEELKVKALSLSIMNKMINGDSELNSELEFDGLRKRITGDQLVAANLTAPSANSPLSLEALDEAIDRVDGATHLLMSKTMRNKLTTAVRAGIGGDIIFDIDEFGNRVAFYNGLPVLIADYDNDGQRMINFNEAGPAGGTTSGSIYVLSIGPGKITGIQNGFIDVKDLGELESKPVFRTRVEWYVGMAVMHGRAASRVWGITNANVTL